MDNRNKKLLDNLYSNVKILEEFYDEKIIKEGFQFPLDNDVIVKLKQ